MTTAEAIRTYVTPDESVDVRERPGFVPVDGYGGSMRPEVNEVGGIFKNVRNHRIEHGMWVSDATVVERFFLKATA